ncbi:hypothetical protein C0993_003113 [Termitomyces sp. T159_Od127]|nr:hypothetical protein C0993_003113 [Termitomyces sp. T159_Od127]
MDIPEELIDLILGHLGSSLDTLLNCTLVKRSWTHAARARLLHKLSFRFSSNHTFPNLTALAKCISTDPSLAQHVSTLELRQTQPSVEIYTKTYTASEQHSLVVSLLAQMTCVRELRLVAIDWAALPETISSAILELLSGHMISKLHFEFFKISSASELARLISSPQSLQTLCLVQLYPLQNSNDTVGVPVGRKNGATLQSLELGTILNFHILDALFCTENRLDFSALRKLCLSANYPPALKSLMNVVGPSIEELFLSTKTLTEPSAPFDLSLASMPKLLRLELTDGITQEALESLFGTLESPHPLREIIVHKDDWVRHSLNAAQTYYLQPALEELTRVEYRIMDHNDEGMRHVYEEAFARLYERGIFFLVQEEPRAVWTQWGLQRYAYVH